MNPYIGDRQLEPDDEPDEIGEDLSHLADPSEPNDYPE